MAIGTDGGAGVCSGGGEKRKRVDELGDRCEAVDRISALPNELRQHILTHLPLKDAIRMGALARGWRDLWKDRWAYPASVEVQLRSRDALLRELDALAREPGPRRRLDRFSLVVETSKLKSSELRRFTEYAAECRVEDLHIEIPSFITLDLCGCHCDLKRRWTIMHWNLRRVTIVDGDFLEMPFFVQSHTALADLSIRFTHPVKEVNHKLKYCYFPKDYPASTSSPYVAMPSRFSLRCQIFDQVPQGPVSIHGLKELQLLMLEMETVNLAGLYVFLKACQCPNLERLFVQLPTFKYLPKKGSVDEVREEPPQDVVMVKVTNFNWCCIEVQLVSFLLRKASSL
ncbi:unnamed protein product [Miscanthus lutarioriparius]|uniref:F-box domain-containing protein n=1 Tax=Miscanthus lutarioriparius TaxID=422564 RepID=A0A811SCK2_9POAL|nr:unnamed protein product [Miscanthus lutarioriparius]